MRQDVAEPYAYAAHDATRPRGVEAALGAARWLLPRVSIASRARRGAVGDRGGGDGRGPDESRRLCGANRRVGRRARLCERSPDTAPRRRRSSSVTLLAVEGRPVTELRSISLDALASRGSVRARQCDPLGQCAHVGGVVNPAPSTAADCLAIMAVPVAGECFASPQSRPSRHGCPPPLVSRSGTPLASRAGTHTRIPKFIQDTKASTPDSTLMVDARVHSCGFPKIICTRRPDGLSQQTVGRRLSPDIPACLLLALYGVSSDRMAREGVRDSDALRGEGVNTLAIFQYFLCGV